MAAGDVIQKKSVKQPGAGFLRSLLWFLIISALGTAVFSLFMGETKTTVLPAHTEAFYINDYSRVWSEPTERYIVSQADALCKATGAQLVVVSVPTTYSDSLEEFSLALARDWGIGDAQADNGVLLLFTTDEAHVRLEIGHGLEGKLNDAKCGRILDDFAVEPMHDGAWNRAAVQTFRETAKAVYDEYGATAPDALLAEPEIDEIAGVDTPADATMPEPVTTVNEDPLWQRLLQSLIGFWLLSWPIWLIVWFSKLFGKTKGTGGGGAFRGGGFSGGGSFGGGGGFSGGGGSFGGGGASR